MSDIVTKVFNALRQTVIEEVTTLSGDIVTAHLGYPNSELSETGSLPAVVIVQISPSFIEPLGFGNYIVTTGSQWFDMFSGSARDHLGVRIIFTSQIDVWARNPRERNYISGQILQTLIYPSSKSNRDFYSITGSRSPQVAAGIRISRMKGMYDIDSRATNISVELPLYQKDEPVQIYRKVLNYELVTEFQWDRIEPLIGRIIIESDVTGSAGELVERFVWATLTGSEEIRY